MVSTHEVQCINVPGDDDDEQTVDRQQLLQFPSILNHHHGDAIRQRHVEDYCSFHVKCHPKLASLEEKCSAWMTELFQAHGLPEVQLQRILDIRYGRLTCMMYSNAASEARSFTLAKLMHWIFLLDDLVDDPRHLGRNLAAARVFCSRLLLSMFGPSNCVAAAGLITTPHDITRELQGIPIEQLSNQDLVIKLGTQWLGDMQAQGISPKQYKHVQVAVVDYLIGILNIVALRGQNKLPSLEEYIVLRRKDGGFDIGIFGCEFDLNMELDNEALAHPLIQDLHQASADQLNWINDILSFNVEYHEGDYINLLRVLHYQNNPIPSHVTHKMSNFEEAFSQAYAMIKAKDKESIYLSHEISVWNPSLQCYVEAIHQCIAGITAWTLGNLHYRKYATTLSTK